MKKLIAAAFATMLLSGTALADTTLKLVEVITSPERTKTLESIVAKFEAANPGTKVEIISLPWGESFQKFATMVSAGEIPDVMEMPDTWVSLYANNGMLENLEPYLEKWETTPDLTERALELGRSVNNTAYTLPYGFYLNAMFYNKKLLSEAGVSEPPKTMDEFVEASKKIAALPGKSGFCMRGGPGGLNGWVIFAASMAGDNKFFNEDGTSTMNSEGWKKGITWMVDLYKNGNAPVRLFHSILPSGPSSIEISFQERSLFWLPLIIDQPAKPMVGKVLPSGPFGMMVTPKSSGFMRSAMAISASGSWLRKAQVPL